MAELVRTRLGLKRRARRPRSGPQKQRVALGGRRGASILAVDGCREAAFPPGNPVLCRDLRPGIRGTPYGVAPKSRNFRTPNSHAAQLGGVKGSLRDGSAGGAADPFEPDAMHRLQREYGTGGVNTALTHGSIGVNRELHFPRSVKRFGNNAKIRLPIQVHARFPFRNCT